MNSVCPHRGQLGWAALERLVPQVGNRVCAWNTDSQVWGQAQSVSGVRRGRGSGGKLAVGARTQTGGPLRRALHCWDSVHGPLGTPQEPSRGMGLNPSFPAGHTPSQWNPGMWTPRERDGKGSRGRHPGQEALPGPGGGGCGSQGCLWLSAHPGGLVSLLVPGRPLCPPAEISGAAAAPRLCWGWPQRVSRITGPGIIGA